MPESSSYGATEHISFTMKWCTVAWESWKAINVGGWGKDALALHLLQAACSAAKADADAEPHLPKSVEQNGLLRALLS